MEGPSVIRVVALVRPQPTAWFVGAGRRRPPGAAAAVSAVLIAGFGAVGLDRNGVGEEKVSIPGRIGGQ